MRTTARLLDDVGGAALLWAVAAGGGYNELLRKLLEAGVIR